MLSSDDFSSVKISELLATHSWQTQYRLITQWGQLIQTKPELRIAKYLVKGCEVSAWLAHIEKNGVHSFAFDSDSRVMNGLAVLLLAQVQHKTTAEIGAMDLAQLLLAVGLEKHLTPSRNNGVRTIALKIKQFAAAE